ncbi:hypothetical protein E1189_01680, partial [Sansalvadorimonas verongulae]|nr:hypothetical protein [Sansalvadorimonas verongulae]
MLKGERQEALVIDLLNILRVGGAVVDQDEFQTFLQYIAGKTLKSGINLLVTPDGKTIDGLKVLKDCVVVSGERYRSTIQPMLEVLNEQDGWTLDVINYDLSDAQPSDTGLFKLVHPFSKASLDDDTIVRRVDEPVFLSSTTEEKVSLPALSTMSVSKARVYLTPLIEGLGFHYDSGEYYELDVHEGKVTLPLSLKEFPTPSWQYRVDIQLTDNVNTEYVRYNLVALNPDEIYFVNVVYFDPVVTGAHENDHALVDKMKKLPVREYGGFCPQL